MVMTPFLSRLRPGKSRPPTRRGHLLAGVSAMALSTLLAAAPARADSLASAIGRAAAAQAAAVASAASAPSRTIISQTANANLAAAGRSLKAALAAQRAVAAARSDFNGLGVGALNPVAQPNSTADGLTDWTGADLPTEEALDGHHDVTVKQTQSRAVLSWDSFNVGSDTTLTFDQQDNGNWIALNRVVGDAAAPSQILGQIKADGEVLVINQNGILFGAGAQVNVHSLIASTAEIGRSFDDSNAVLTVAQRNAEFLEYGLTGYAESQGNVKPTFSGTTAGYDNEQGILDPVTRQNYNYRQAAVEVEDGAVLTADSGGMIALIAPTVTNAGSLSAADGQVSLIGLSGKTGTSVNATQSVQFLASDGGEDALDSDVRGVLPITNGGTAYLDEETTATALVGNSGVIEAERGYVSLGGRAQVNGEFVSDDGSVVNAGILRASTGISANGVIDLLGGAITLAEGSLILVDADDGGDTVAQDQASLANFKTSKVRIGSDFSDVVMDGGAMIVAPSGDITIGQETTSNREDAGSIVLQSGAVIDVSGLKEVSVPLSHYNLSIALYGNELADSGGYQDSFLYGKTVWIDARKSGVREDGVAWVGSPLISAAAYYEAVGVTAPEMLTRGGTVTLMARDTRSVLSPTTTANVTVAEGAAIDISGGWVTYQGGTVKTTQLLNSTGQVVDIGQANPLTDSFVAIRTGASRTSAKWGKAETWKSLGTSLGTQTETSYTEGRDAGTLALRSAMVTFEGALNAAAQVGVRQIAKGAAGTGTSGVYGDVRKVQGAWTEVPAGGMLFVETSAAIVVDHGAGAAAEKTVVLSDAVLSGVGLSQVSVWSGGSITVAETAEVELRPGGVFDALAGRAITVAGTISAPSGTIVLETYDSFMGSIFDAADDTRVKGSFDITVTGTLSVAGLWVNDLGKAGVNLGGSAWLDGGDITMVSAASLTDGQAQAVVTVDNDPGYETTTDISGSILLAEADRIDLSGGGRVTAAGRLDLSGRGGDLSLINQTAFHLATTLTSDARKSSSGSIYGKISGFRVRDTVLGAGGVPVNAGYQINPEAVTSTVAFDMARIRAAGFSGGGTFTLWAPDIRFGSGSADDTATATAVPLDVFSTAGFGTYSLTSYKTALIDNAFVDTNGDSLGGKNALLQTQTFRVRSGETLRLSQAMLPTLLDDGQTAALLGLESGGDLHSVLTASVPVHVWDQKAVTLTLDGMVELVVEAGGTITAAPGATLTVAKLKNQGTIRLPGGAIRQQQTVAQVTNTRAIRALSDIFTVAADGSIVETETSVVGDITNAGIAGGSGVYLLGEMEAADGIVLAAGGVTDLSGISVLDPYAVDARGAALRTGVLHGGGTITLVNSSKAGAFFRYGRQANSRTPVATAQIQGLALTVAGGATVDLSGTRDTYREIVSGQGVVSREVWSDAGAISTPNAFTLSSEARITARGGAAGGRGGTLELADVILTQDVAEAARELSADQLMASGVSTLTVWGSLGSEGEVSLTLDRAFYLTSAPLSIGDSVVGGSLRVTVGASGALDITAPYIGLIGKDDTLPTPSAGEAVHAVTLHATSVLDVAGAIFVDPSIATLALTSDGDLRLIGVADPEIVYDGASRDNTALIGGLSVARDLIVTAAQVYPTTGTTFTIASRAEDGAIVFARSRDTVPAAPYSAGGSLTVTANTIEQGGVLRVPMGSLTLTAADGLTLTGDSYTEVSTNGLTIPYGTTTDGKEWYFSPTGGNALSVLPEKVLALSGEAITLEAGAVVNVSGGGDVTAYEFAAGTGGSRDVLNSYNDDLYTSTTGCTYKGCVPAYAIVPGLSDQAVAAYDPVYSADYASLSSVGGLGRRVWLDLGDGLRWYTLLPARYATLPGGRLVVQQTAGAASLPLGSTYRRADGTLMAAGVYGDALSGAAGSTIYKFAVQKQGVYSKYSSITLTSGNEYFANLAEEAGTVVPRLARDAGRLALGATSRLVIDTIVRSAAGGGGRGAQVDVGGADIHIASALPDEAAEALYVTAAGLTNLGAESLLIGATRTVNADGSTTLAVTAGSITVENDADHALEAAEVVLASTGDITVADGAAITAVGTLSDRRDGAYRIGDGVADGTGALLRVANGVERLTSRQRFRADATLTVGEAALSGTSVMFDSSGRIALSSAMTIAKATRVALGAGRIGLGITDADYDGVVVTDGLRTLLTANGGGLTLRSQSSIDFAGGTYAFGDIRLDAAALAGSGGGAVTLRGDRVTLGNAGAEGTVCGDCTGTGGRLSIEAREILFAGGAMATQATVTAEAITATLRQDTEVILAKGTRVYTTTNVLDRDTPITIAAGTVVVLAAGTGLVTPIDAAGLLAAGSEVTAANLGLSLASGASVVFTETTTTTDNQGRLSTLTAGNTYQLVQDVTLTVPSGSALVLDADVGVVGTDFFGGGVSLTATEGIFATGAGGGLDTGTAALALHTPYLGDRAAAAAGGDTAIPGLTLVTTGLLTIDAAAAAAEAMERATLGGIAGTSLNLHGGRVDISGTTVHATAGTVTVTAETSLALSDGAVIEAPGHVATFGDQTDSTTRNAPGGTLRLTARSGDIALGADTLVSVGGGTGDAGRLELAAAAGAVFLDGALDGTAGAGGAGGVFALESRGGIDLAALNDRVGADGFTGGFEVHTHSGDLTLAAGQTLRSGSVLLTADGGMVTIGGTVDTSGVTGGDIGLYGAAGVTLEATARLDAHATGYASDDPRRARSGDVTLGTDFLPGTAVTGADGVVTGTSGTITIAEGAAIDQTVAHTVNRIVRLANGAGYHYVAADIAGTLTLRAPVIDGGAGPQTVQIGVESAASVIGAGRVEIEGFRRWDLARVADSGLYAGVTRDAATATVTLDARTDLDPANDDGTRSEDGGVNFLGDEAPGTLPDFVQTFDISAAYAGLGGLAEDPAFHARPGLDLAYEGGITLASTWNFGAGVVDIDAALAAGVMTGSDGAASVVLGREGELLGAFTRMIYRTGGSAFGEAPALTLRAGGDLHLEGSLTDGFFQFADPYAAGTTDFGVKVNIGSNSYYEFFIDEDTWEYGEYLYIESWTEFSLTYNYILYGGSSSVVVISAEDGGGTYNNAGNSAAAETAGDTLANALMVPRACRDAACSEAAEIASTSYRLVAGAEMAREGGSLRVSANPAQIDRERRGDLSIAATVSRDVTRPTTYNLLFPTICDFPFSCEGGWGDAEDFAAAYLASLDDYVATYEDPYGWFVLTGVDDLGTSTLRLGGFTGGNNIDVAVAAFMNDLAVGDNPELNALIDQHGSMSPSQDKYKIEGPRALISYFLTHYGFTDAFVADVNLTAAAQGKTSPFPVAGSYTLTTRNMIRTGTGDITLAAAGDIDLTGGPGRAAVYDDAVAVYTTGTRAATGTVSALDVATGTTASVALGAHRGSAGLYLSGGGDIVLTAGRDVLGTTVTYLTQTYSSGGSVSATSLQWFTDPDLTSGDFAADIAWADQELDLAAFTTGVGAFAGGDVTVTAGRDVDDVAVAATPAIRSVDITLADGTEALGLEILGDGAVALTAGRDLRGGLAYVTSGSLTLDAGRDITDDGWSQWRSYNKNKVRITPRLRVLNATAAAGAAGAVTLTWDDTLPVVGGWWYSTINWYSAIAAATVVANGDIGFDLHSYAGLGTPVAMPGSLALASLTGDLSFTVAGGGSTGMPGSMTLLPAADGQLALLTGGDIGRVILAMGDADPASLPSPFRSRTAQSGGIGFPTVTSHTTEAALRLQHNAEITHAGDDKPVQVMAGGDITAVTLSLPKQARVVAGGDIVDMMFFGQNLTATDVTRIKAGGTITATSTLATNTEGTTAATLGGNTFVSGGPGDIVLEAGGAIGPFLNSATVETGDGVFTTGGGVLSVGYDRNPFLKPAVIEAGGGANVTVLFGLGEIGPDYAALAETYVDPANAGALDWDGYAGVLAHWLSARHGLSGLSETEAYEVFQALSPLERQLFLLSEVYFTELMQAAVPESDSYQRYSRGYQAVNTLFPAANGYTANGLQGGAVHTERRRLGDLDLRLATVQTTRGGDIRVLGPGGDVLAGSVVRTSTQAERRNYRGVLTGIGTGIFAISAIPTGLEGLLTLRGGALQTFTDGSLVLNQSRAFTQQGGDVVMWSSNGDLNAGEGPKTTVTYTPKTVRFDWNAYGEVDEAASVAGAGIAAFGSGDGATSSDVYLLAPRGTVDAGDAGIRVAGNISIVAYQVRNADNIQVGGQSFGVPVMVAPDTGALSAASDSAGKAADAANEAAKASRQMARRDTDLPSIITFQVIGYGGGEGGGDGGGSDAGNRRGRAGRRPGPPPVYDPDGAVRFSAPEEATPDRP
jgi:filamentous hemagglutinin family protein